MVNSDEREMKRIFFRFTPEFHKKLKMVAAREDMTMTDLIVKLVEEHYTKVSAQNGNFKKFVNGASEDHTQDQ